MDQQRMRIIAGTHKGHRLVSPPGRETRPTSDRVREALFSRLESQRGGSLVGETVLDAFAGSGALAFEALSRGAEHATLLERDRAAMRAIRRNAAALGFEGNVTILAVDALAPASRGRLPAGPFSLLFLDPPYRIDKSEVRALVECLARSQAIGQGALAVWEHGTGTSADWPDGFESMGVRQYGSTSIDIAVTVREGER